MSKETTKDASANASYNYERTLSPPQQDIDFYVATHLIAELALQLAKGADAQTLSNSIRLIGQASSLISDEANYTVFELLSTLIKRHPEELAVSIVRNEHLVELVSRHGEVPMTTVLAMHSEDAAKIIMTNHRLALKHDNHGWSSAHEAASCYDGFVEYLNDPKAHDIASFENGSGFSVRAAAERRARSMLRTK